LRTTRFWIAGPISSTTSSGTGKAVQDIDYDTRRRRLVKTGQVVGLNLVPAKVR